MSAEESKFKRNLTLKDLILIGIGGTIGPGIFLLTSSSVGFAGPAAIVTHLLVILIVLFSAFSYSELATMFPIAGGGYVFVRKGIGGLSSFLTGFFIYFAEIAYGAFSAFSFALIFGDLLATFGVFLTFNEKMFLAEIAILAFSFINLKGGKGSKSVQIVLSLILATFLLIILSIGGFRTFTAGFWPSDFIPYGTFSIFTSMAIIYVMYFGSLEILSAMSGEVIEPERNIPRGIIGTVLIAATIYTLVTLIIIFNVPYTTLHEYVIRGETPNALLWIAQDTLGIAGAAIIGIIGIIATLSSLNVTLSAASRVSYALAYDEYFPKAFAKKDPKKGSPRNSIILTTLIMAMLASTGLSLFIASVANLLLILCLAIVNLNVIILKHKRPYLKRPFRSPVYPYITIIATIANFLMLPAIIAIDPRAILLGGGIAAVAFLIFAYNLAGIARVRIQVSGMCLGASFLLLLGLYFVFVYQPIYYSVLLFIIGMAIFAIAIFGIISALVLFSD